VQNKKDKQQQSQHQNPFRNGTQIRFLSLAAQHSVGERQDVQINEQDSFRRLTQHPHDDGTEKASFICKIYSFFSVIR